MPKRSFPPRDAEPTRPDPTPPPTEPAVEPPTWVANPYLTVVPTVETSPAPAPVVTSLTSPDPGASAPAPAAASRPAASGWRRALRAVGGSLRTPASGRQDERRIELARRARRQLAGTHQVAVVSLKGGVGKTTTTALLGLALAEHREDRIIALDSSPVGGTLGERLVDGPELGVRDLLDDFEQVGTRHELHRYTGLVGRLRVLASDQDLARNVALNSVEYEKICLLLRRHYDVIITDGATGMVHPAMAGTLAFADSIVVVGSLTVDGAGRASKTLDWLIAHGYRNAAARAVLVLDGDRASGEVDADRLHAHFAARCRAVVEIPHDPHLAQGGRIDTSALSPTTRDATLELAALIADEFDAVTAGRG